VSTALLPHCVFFQISVVYVLPCCSIPSSLWCQYSTYRLIATFHLSCFPCTASLLHSKYCLVAVYHVTLCFLVTVFHVLPSCSIISTAWLHYSEYLVAIFHALPVCCTYFMYCLVAISYVLFRGNIYFLAAVLYSVHCRVAVLRVLLVSVFCNT
jgi:hypothetical protein